MAVAIADTRPEAAAPATGGVASSSETTRLLCAAAYLHGTFAQDVIDEVADERFRAVQAPEGVDVVPVVRHCLAAHRRKNVRDFLLIGVVVATAVAWGALGNAAMVLVGFLAAWAVVVWDLWTARYNVVMGELTASAFDPARAPEVSDAEVAERLTEVAARSRGNVTVYSGFNPFAASGFDHGCWSFAMNVRKGADRMGDVRSPISFDVRELYGSVTSAIETLEIPGLELEDRLFVNGTDLRDDRLLLPEIVGRPVAAVSDRDLERFVARPSHRVRAYKCVRVMDWDGELVVSLFLRFGLEKGRLFTELSRFALAPLKPEYRRVDEFEGELTLRQAASILLQALRQVIPLLYRSPQAVVRPFLHRRREARALRRVRREVRFDYGAPITALDRARSDAYSRYFQKLDHEMHVKVLERGILDAIVDFLDHHDIDTAELTERRDTIVNNGIMVPGGAIKADNIAVGQGASIFARMRTGTAPKPAAGGRG